MGGLLVLLACCIALGAVALPARALAESASGSAATSTEDAEKYETPTVSKEIGEVTNATNGGEPEGWYEAADATVGESVPYRITGTLPSNWDEYETYYYEFHDTQDAAIVVDATSVNVCLVRTATGETVDITAAFTIVYDADEHVLTAVCADLKQAAEGITADDTVVLTYTATLDAAQAASGTDGAAQNTVYIRYSSNPGTSEIGQSVEDETWLYTWALQIEKVAQDTEEPLAGAGFTIQAEDGRYLSADGTLSTEAVELFTGAEGYLTVSGVDAGTYTVRETTAPTGYTAVGTFTITIESQATSGTPQLTLTVSGLDADSAKSATNATGTVVVLVRDTPGDSSIPYTISRIIGKLTQTGDTGWWLAVLVLLLVGAGVVVAGLLLGRRGGRDDGAGSGSDAGPGGSGASAGGSGSNDGSGTGGTGAAR